MILRLKIIPLTVGCACKSDLFRGDSQTDLIAFADSVKILLLKKQTLRYCDTTERKRVLGRDHDKS